MDYLISTFSEGRKWAKILGIILIAMFILQGLTLFTAGIAAIFGVIIAALLYLMPGLMLVKYAKAVEKAENGNDPISEIEEACLRQGKYFQFVGIAVAIAMVVMIVAVVLMLFLGVTMS